MKHSVKQFLGLCLLLAMVLSMAACGAAPAADPQETEAPAEPDELVYKAEFTPISVPAENGLSSMAFTDDGVYAQSWEKIGEREIPEDAVIRYEGEYDIYGPVLYFVGYDGNCRKLEAYQGVPVPEDTEDRMDYYGSSSMSRLIPTDDGNLLSLEELYIGWYDGPESERYGDEQYNYREYEQHTYLRKLDTEGAELSIVELETGSDEYVGLYTACLDDDGNVLCPCDTSLLAFAPDGTLRYVIENDSYVENIVRLKDDRIGVIFWGDQGMEMQLLDTQKRELGESVKLPYNAYNLLPGGGDYDLFFSDGMNLYGYTLGDETGTKLLNWINVDINGNQLNGFRIGGDGSINALLCDLDTGTPSCEMARLALVPASTLPKRQILTLAVLDLDSQVQSRIISFNRHSDTVRIEVVNYSDYRTEEDYNAGLTKLTTEIMAGNLPDLLSVGSLPYDQLANKGLLVDLYPYLDADEELSRDSFFPTVLKALEQNGGLYQVAPSFQIVTLIGASSVVGPTPGWNYDQFNAALASMPAGCSPLDQYTTRDDVLRRLVELEMDGLVNWTTGECRFDSPDYVNILNFAKRFQEEFDWEHYEWTADDSTETRIAEGRQMLMAGNIYSVDDLMFNDIYFGGEATYIGYPVSSGVGSMMVLNSGFAMTSKCSDRDAAWSFLRSVLTEEYEETVWGLPINRKAFDKKLEEAMKVEYEKDAEGNILLDENGEKRQVSRGGVGMADGSVRQFYALTQEQADKLLDVINGTTRVRNDNNSVITIVSEEAQAFFAGQKSAEEVARLTQSKVNIYVNEQR